TDAEGRFRLRGRRGVERRGRPAEGCRQCPARRTKGRIRAGRKNGPRGEQSPVMNWSDEGIVLSVRPHGETAAVVELLTRAHGRHFGLVHGGRSRKARPVLQIGNQVSITWKARLAEHLGHMQLELLRGYAATAMEDAAALSGL